MGAACARRAPLRAPSSEEVAVLGQLVEKASTKFDPDTNPTQMAMLQEMWSTFHDNIHGASGPFLRSGKDWCKIGFQSEDPVSDVRGGGQLAVEQLLYFMKEFPSTAIGMAECRNDGDTEQYMPWATAGINVTAMLLEIFGAMEHGLKRDFTAHQHAFFHFAATEVDFHRLYVVAFEELDTTWDKEHGTYLSFHHIEETVKNHMLKALNTGPANVEELKARLKLNYEDKKLPQQEEDAIREARKQEKEGLV